MCLKAFITIYRSVFLRLEGYLCCFTAVCANSIEHLSGSTACVLLCLTAFTATTGLILETFFSVEFLLTCSENEFLAAIFAD